MVKPCFIITYIDTNGLSDYQDYTTLPSKYKSNFAVNNYTVNLIYSYNSVDMPGTRSAVNITHYYNSADYDDANVVSKDFPASAVSKKAYYGKGFRTNLNQQLSDKTISGKSYKVHTDADGTKHYFELVSGSSPAKWEYEFDKKTFITQDNIGDYYIQYEDGSKLGFWQWSRRLFKIVDSDNNILELDYGNDLYYPIKIKDGLGQVTTLAYSNDYLTSVTDSAGRQTRFEYHTDGRLKYIIDPMSGYTEFYYNTDGYPMSIWSPYRQRVGIEYGNATPRTGLKKVTKVLEESDGTAGNFWQFNYYDGETVVTDRQEIHRDNSGLASLRK